MFSALSRLLVGNELSLKTVTGGDADARTFLISSFGWTICLPSVGDTDPFSVKPEAIYIHKGVPTHTKTQERKDRVRDAIPPSLELVGRGDTSDFIIDHRESFYVPRCVSPVSKREEYHTTRDNSFDISLKFSGRHEIGNSPWFGIQTSYRALHDALWATITAPKCEHCEGEIVNIRSQNVELGLDVVTAAGIWSFGEGKNPLPMRIIVVLVKGDRHARWLAVNGPLHGRKLRNIMLRGCQSCEDCAVKAASRLPGNWFVII